MKRLVWRGGEDLALEYSSGSVPSPQRDEVLLKIRAVGICGTDIHILKGALPLAKPPMVLGHEVSGEIAAVGANVDHVREGDRVTLDAVVGCGHCYLCQRGSFQFCAKGFEFGITRDGGCQEYLVVPKRNVYRIADTVSFEEAAILDMEVYNAVRKCGVEAADSVLVLGAGPIGLIACQVARIFGAAHITLSDVLIGRLDAAPAGPLLHHVPFAIFRRRVQVPSLLLELRRGSHRAPWRRARIVPRASASAALQSLHQGRKIRSRAG